MRTRIKPLKLKHFIEILKRAFDHAFIVERNVMGWAKKGILPRFTMREFWRLKEEVNVHASHVAAGREGYNGSNVATVVGIGFGICATAVRLRILQGGKASPALNQSAAEAPTLELSLPHSLRIEIDRAAASLPSVEALASMDINDIIAAYLLWHQEVFSKVRTLKKKRKASEKADPEAAREDKRRKTQCEAHTKLAALVEKISAGGLRVIDSLVVDDLKAMLRSEARSKAPEPKGNKADSRPACLTSAGSRRRWQSTAAELPRSVFNNGMANESASSDEAASALSSGNQAQGPEEISCEQGLMVRVRAITGGLRLLPLW
eukprot:jgi/Tetstr1/434103/TSEL_023247.t1